MKTLKMVQRVIIFSVTLFCVSKAQTVNSGYINVGNDKLFYETAGSGSAIIFIHDGLVHSKIWDEQFLFFSKNYKVIRYDRRGYGNSPVPTDAFSNLEDLNSLFVQLDIDKACLVALSSGGRLAIDFTLQYPQKVTALVLVGAVVGGFGFTDHFDNRGGNKPANIKTIQESRVYLASKDPYELYRGNKEAKKKIKQIVKNIPMKSDPNSLVKTVSAKPAYTRLNEIKIPALILAGEFDIPDVHAHAGAINAGIANSKRDVIPMAGHLAPIEQPALFNKAVFDFLNEAIK
jgi:3-oxoadipate enol-lactonase